jgi:hypothetical protein
MMLKYLSQFDAFLWLATAFWQVVVVVVALRPSFRRAYPAFGSFACFAAITTPILMVLPGVLYFLGYAIVSTATCVLLWATLFELYTEVCGPNFSLPSWVPRTMASWLALALGASAAATCGLYSVRLLEKRAAVLAATQGGMLMALCLALVILVSYSKYLRMEWQARPRQIVVGLGLYVSANAAVLLLLSHVPVEFMRLLDRSSQGAILISLIWWTFTLRRREPAPEPLTPEEKEEMNQIMATILAVHRETMETAESIGLIQPVK